MREHPTAFFYHADRRPAEKAGRPHDGRAPDYDDWTLNGDLLFGGRAAGPALEVSSMGIRWTRRACAASARPQAAPSALELPFHRAVLQGEKCPEYRRGDRPKPAVHAAAGQGPHRGRSGQPVAQADDKACGGGGIPLL